MSWARLLWGWRGRLNRRQCLLGLLGLGLLSSVGWSMWLLSFAPPSDGEVRIASSLAGAILFPFQVSMLFRRAHDLGYSGAPVIAVLSAVYVWTAVDILWPSLTNSWLQIAIGLISGLLAFWLLLAPGQRERNRFGDPPRDAWTP